MMRIFSPRFFMSLILDFYDGYKLELYCTLIMLAMSLFVFACNKLTKKANFLCFMQRLTAGIAIISYLIAVLEDEWFALYGHLFAFISIIMFFIIMLLSYPDMKRFYVETLRKNSRKTEANDQNEVRYPTYEEVYGTKDNAEILIRGEKEE